MDDFEACEPIKTLGPRGPSSGISAITSWSSERRQVAGQSSSRSLTSGLGDHRDSSRRAMDDKRSARAALLLSTYRTAV